MHITINFFPLIILAIGIIITLIIIKGDNKNNNDANEEKNGTNDFIDSTSKELNDMIDTFGDIGKKAVNKAKDVIDNGIKEKKYCGNCGEKIDKDSKFCKNCGKKI